MSKSIVIVHGGDLAEPCGGTNRVFTFANHLLNEGYDIHLIVPEFGNDHLIGQGAVDDRFTIHMLPVKAKLTPGIASAEHSSYQSKQRKLLKNIMLHFKSNTQI
jgi:hypothetical protein